MARSRLKLACIGIRGVGARVSPLVEFELHVCARIEQVVQVRGDAVLQLSIPPSHTQRQRCQEAVHLIRHAHDIIIAMSC